MWKKLSESQKQHVRAQLGSAARKGILIVGAWLLAKSGIDITPYIASFLDHDNAWIGGVVLIGLGWLWSARKHLHWNRKVDTALPAPPDTSRKQLEKAVEQGKTLNPG
jgi:hypothetical protein